MTIVKAHLPGPGWALPLYEAAATLPAAGYRTMERIVQGLTFQSTTLPDWTLADWGYGKGKARQLTRHYVVPEELARVQRILQAREDQAYTSVALSLRGIPKRDTSMGWCMLSMVITKSTEWTRVEVQYRTTEVIKRFAADVWLIGKLVNELKLQPSLYSFHFANCSLTSDFAYLVNKLNLVKFLGKVHAADPEFFLRVSRPLLKSTYKRDQFFPFAPANKMHHYLWKHATVGQILELREFLEPIRRKAGLKLPKDFHDKSTYVTRAKRAQQEMEE